MVYCEQPKAHLCENYDCLISVLIRPAGFFCLFVWTEPAETQTRLHTFSSLFLLHCDLRSSKISIFLYSLASKEAIIQ